LPPPPGGKERQGYGNAGGSYSTVTRKRLPSDQIQRSPGMPVVSDLRPEVRTRTRPFRMVSGDGGLHERMKLRPSTFMVLLSGVRDALPAASQGSEIRPAKHQSSIAIRRRFGNCLENDGRSSISCSTSGRRSGPGVILTRDVGR